MTIEASPLSIIIPVLNEAECLPLLLNDLAQQKNIQFDVIIVDGGSSDQTSAICQDFASNNSNTNLLALHFVTCASGRARQMNQGARLSKADDYLF